MRVLDDWLLLPQRFAVHEPSATAVLADLHLGYAAARQLQGDAIPVRSVRDELAPLFIAAQRVDFRNVIIAGDLFERGYDAEIAGQFLGVLDELRVRLIGLVPGNHDRGVDVANSTMPIFSDGYDLDGWRILHGDGPCQADNVVMGHWHPALRSRGGKLPCFIVHQRRLVLPAFSLDAAGVDVGKDKRWHAWTAYAIRNGTIKAAGKSE